MSAVPPRPVWANSNDPLPQTRASTDSQLATGTNLDLTVARPTGINHASSGSIESFLKGSNNLDKVPPLQLVAVNFWRVVNVLTYYAGQEYKTSNWTVSKVTNSELTELKSSCSEVFDGGTAEQSFSNTDSFESVQESGSASSMSITVPPGQNHYDVVWQWTTAYAYLPQTVAATDADAQPFYFDDPTYWASDKNYGFAIGFQDWVYVGGQVIGAAYDFYEDGTPVPAPT